MPTVLLEAMAAGLPIIATRIPGNTEITDPEFGRLVTPGDAQQLALALLDMTRDVASLRRMGSRASLFARRFDWSIIASRIAEVASLVSR
jgi:glycosyltransferase involved in cell wall biosynthesis